MDEPADGPTARRRRHARSANSVSVAELLAKSTPAEQASVSAIQARAAAERTAPPVQPVQPGPPAPQIPPASHVPPPTPPGWPPVLPPGRPALPIPEGATRPLPMVRGYPGGDTSRDVPRETSRAIGYVDHDEPLFDPSATAATADELDEADDEARPEDEGDEPRGSGRLARTIVVTLVAMVATGVVTAVAAIGGEPPRRLAPSVPVVQPVAMTGPAVLRLSVVIDTLSLGSPEVIPSAPVSGPSGTSPSEPAPTGVTTAGLLSGSGQAAQGSPTPSGGRPPTSPPVGPVDRERAESVVLDFYEALPRQTDHAFGLLDAAMQGDGRESFDAAWRRANAVNPRILPSDDDSVRASISVSRFNDSEVTRLIVRLDVRPVAVDGAAQLRIVGAELLSAHRS